MTLIIGLIVGFVIAWFFINVLLPVFLIALVYVIFQDQINAVVGGIWDVVGGINLIEVLELAFTIGVVGVILGAIALAVRGASHVARTRHR